MLKDFGFGVRYGLRIFRFLASGFRFSKKIIAVFRFYYPIWFLGFPILRVSEDFGFGRIFLRFSMIFSSVLRFLIYPNVPLVKARKREYLERYYLFSRKHSIGVYRSI